MWLSVWTAALLATVAFGCKTAAPQQPDSCSTQVHDAVAQASAKTRHNSIECNQYNKKLQNCKGDSLCQAYKCVCRKPGLVYVPGVGCKDVNECKEIETACFGANVTCVNTQGGFQCQCQQEGHSYHPLQGCGNHTTCHFPFKFQGTYHHHCIRSGHHRLWCSLTADYDKDKKYMNCAAEFTTMHCHFPFIYKGKEHKACIDGKDGKWCATTNNFDTDKKWNICY